jgi:hypothetical protein
MSKHTSGMLPFVNQAKLMVIVFLKKLLVFNLLFICWTFLELIYFTGKIAWVQAYSNEFIRGN